MLTSAAALSWSIRKPRLRAKPTADSNVAAFHLAYVEHVSYKVARELVRGFGTSRREALWLLRGWNEGNTPRARDHFLKTAVRWASRIAPERRYYLVLSPLPDPRPRDLWRGFAAAWEDRARREIDSVQGDGLAPPMRGFEVWIPPPPVDDDELPPDLREIWPARRFDPLDDDVQRAGGAPIVERARRYAAKVAGEPEGARNDAAYKLAATLTRGFALGEAEALPILQDWNCRNCPPLDDAELRTCLVSAMKYARGVRGDKLDPRPRPVRISQAAIARLKGGKQ